MSRLRTEKHESPAHKDQSLEVSTAFCFQLKPQNIRRSFELVDNCLIFKYNLMTGVLF